MTTAVGAAHNDSFDDGDEINKSPYEISPHLVEEDSVNDSSIEREEGISESPYVVSPHLVDGDGQSIIESRYEISPYLFEDNTTSDGKPIMESPYEISPHLIDDDFVASDNSLKEEQMIDRRKLRESLNYENSPCSIEATNDSLDKDQIAESSPYEISPDMIDDDSITIDDSHDGHKNVESLYEVSPDMIDDDFKTISGNLDEHTMSESTYEISPDLVEEDSSGGVTNSPYEISPHLIDGDDNCLRDGRALEDMVSPYEIDPDDIDEGAYESFDDDDSDHNDKDGFYCNHHIDISSDDDDDEQDYYTEYKKRTCSQCPLQLSIENEDSTEVAYSTVDVLFSKETLLRQNKLKQGSLLHNSEDDGAILKSNYEVSFSDELSYSESDYLALNELEYSLKNEKNNNDNNNNNNTMQKENNRLRGRSIYEILPKTLFDDGNLEENNIEKDIDDIGDSSYYEAVNDDYKRGFIDYEDHSF